MNEEQAKTVNAGQNYGAVEEFMDLLKSILIAGVAALFIRTFLFEPFNIPSESMYPTLLVGDYLFVEKYSYGYSQYSFPFGIVSFKGRFFETAPARGDVAVFRQPPHPDVDYIKRIIGLPGDKIQVKEGILHINGEPMPRQYVDTEVNPNPGRFAVVKKYIETLPEGQKHFIYEFSDEEALDDTIEYTVPEGHYFAMGDNRDNSQDSRVEEMVGFVPAENLVGRAAFLFYSTAGAGDTCDRDGFMAGIRSIGCRIITWPQVIRYSRILNRVHTL